MSCCCFDTVSTSEVGVIQRFGKYNRLAEAGLVFLACPCEYIVGRVSLKVQQNNVTFETKTKDNVFVNIFISIQYQAVRDKIYSAFYALKDHNQQMTSYVYDIVRASLTTMTLDQAFEAKEEISSAVKLHLQEVMDTYGTNLLLLYYNYCV